MDKTECKDCIAWVPDNYQTRSIGTCHMTPCLHKRSPQDWCLSGRTLSAEYVAQVKKQC